MTSLGSNTGSAKMLIAMVGIGLVCALLIVLTFEKTGPIIKKNKAEALEKAIFKVIPNTTQVKTFKLTEDQNFVEIEEKREGDQLVFAGYNEANEFVGLAIEASGQGYADVIRILYGYKPDKEIVVGFYVLETKETPGLGDKIEKDENFLANFNALDVSLGDDSKLNNEIVTVKNGSKENPWEVDGITGATISSRAIGDILAESTKNWIPVIYANKDFFKINQKEEATHE
jgi:electron transport complex protein RnfG